MVSPNITMTLRDVPVRMAGAAGGALMPSYTHLRRAQPVLVAHFFLSHAAALRRDYARFTAAIEEADALTLGSGANFLGSLIAGAALSWWGVTNSVLGMTAMMGLLVVAAVLNPSVRDVFDRALHWTFLGVVAMAVLTFVTIWLIPIAPRPATAAPREVEVEAAEHNPATVGH